MKTFFKKLGSALLSKNGKVALLTILTVLVIDQCLKFWVKTNMNIGEEFFILGLPWARIHFVENAGMAFGLEFGAQWGKLALSLFRLVAVSFLIYLLYRMIIQKEKSGAIVGFSMVIAGALGNIIDSVFYGRLFSASLYHGGVAEFLPEGGGYAPFLMGKVVDMFYFPLIRSRFPDWSPLWPGQEFEFFRPVFNVADSSIFIGICILLIFYNYFFKEKQSGKSVKLEEAAESQE